MTDAGRRWRRDFPALARRPGRPRLAYLDSACMSLVPTPVLRAMESYYTETPGCAGRSLHRWSEAVGQRVAAARATFARFFRTPDPAGVVFLRNATEAINLVGQGLPWRKGEAVLLSDQEHNSNLVPWQRLARERGIRLEFLPLPDDGSFPWEEFHRRLGRAVRLVSLFHTSNLDGRSLPVRAIAEAAHDRGARVLIDGCQAAPHRPIDLARWGIDYYAVSAHKMLGPTGTGALLAPPERLADLRPLLLGGETVEWSTLTEHALRPPPHRLEAGLQNYAGILGAAAALDYLDRVGLESVERIQRELNRTVTDALAGEPRLRRLGPADPRLRPSIFAFTLAGIDPHDAALFLDAGHGVLVRSGRHCVHSWYDRRGLTGSIRASFYLYNTRADAAALVRGIRELLDRIPGRPDAGAAPAAGRIRGPLRASSRRSARSPAR
ncbi:MAG: aminotransferase class V-fold PLP-dependent enzyme [Thermoplasmata archaeon]